MSNALVTIAAPIAVGRLPQALALIEAMGNPADPAVAAALDLLDGDEGVHFVSLHAIPPTDPDSPRGHLVMEFSADGTEDVAIGRIAARIGDRLSPIFALAQGRGGGDLAGFLRAHKVRLGQGWFGQPGLAFAGTPDMTVGRIRRETALADALAWQVGAQDGGIAALGRLEAIRKSVRADPALAWALTTPAALPVPPVTNTIALVFALLGAFIRTYLWPLAIPVLLVLAFGLWNALHTPLWPADATLIEKARALSLGAWTSGLWVLGVLCAFAVPVILLLGALYIDLRKKERSDWLDERSISRKVLAEILKRENHLAQNHMVSITTLKPGLTRMFTIRLAFWLVAALAPRLFKPGFLGDIGTIHFARWVTLPGTRDLVFFSNFGGSWESYLEDFITRAHAGLTAVWSNTVGFPRTVNLIQQGATDGERFKRYARRSMIHTPFWYSAYPALTTDNVRSAAAIRVGLAAAMTDEEAVTWLALFGSASRPAAKLESDQIQSLVFGGLGFMPHGRMLLVDLLDHMPSARGWLRDLTPLVVFDDGRRLGREAVVTLALGPGALARAGLPEDALETFPPAFLDGMTGPGRARILGDHPYVSDDPRHAWWWRTEGAYDAAILVYGTSDKAADALLAQVAALTENYGHTVALTQALQTVPPTPIEPFGFVDGISQPVIRGTYRGLRNADPIHLVEPGEFILGYPDNRGNIPPGPTLRALDDPDNLLPIQCSNTGNFGDNVVELPREIGRNGSFLVIRHLEQDTAAFAAYCAEESKRLKERLGEPYDITPGFIAAKLVGRWADGSSLIRNPYRSFTGSSPLETKPTHRPGANPGEDSAIAPPPPSAALAESVGATITPLVRLTVPVDQTARAGVARRSREKRRRFMEDNDFLFGAEDPQGLRCPFGAHIRRANPRDSLDPGNQDQIDISNRHRIIRVGRAYVPARGQKPGLMFMCLNGDIERQFEFVQQTWLSSETFQTLSAERDPLAGNRDGCPAGFTIPTRDGPIRLKPMSQFVIPRGGGYFFLPGRKLLEFLGA